MEAKGINIGGRVAKRITLGGKVLWEQSAGMPSGLVLWYDVARQGCTAQSLANDAHLLDLSGNGNHMELVSYNSDLDNIGNGCLHFGNPRNHYGRVTLPIATNDFTLIVKRNFDPVQPAYSTVAGCNTNAGQGIIFEQRDPSEPGGWFSCSLSSIFQIVPTFGLGVSYMTAHTYNGMSPTKGAARVDNSTFLLGIMRPSYTATAVMDFYSLMLFDHSLDSEEINTIIAKYF